MDGSGSVDHETSCRCRPLRRRSPSWTASRRRRRNPFRRGRSPSSCRSRPAARSTRWRACSTSRCSGARPDRSSSRTWAAPAARIGDRPRRARGAGRLHASAWARSASMSSPARRLSLPFDVLTDFEPVALLPNVPYWMVARKNLPANILKELIAWLKANPDKASAGVGRHRRAWRDSAACDSRRRPARASSSCRIAAARRRCNDLVARPDRSRSCDLAANSLAQFRNGNIKAYGGDDQGAAGSCAPEIPTADEAGVPGLYSHTGTASGRRRARRKDVVAKLNAAVIAALADAAVRKRIADARHGSAAAAARRRQRSRRIQKAEIEKWWPIIKAAGIKVE